MKPRIFTPHPYQKMISDHILDVPRCAVWAGMGMGKSCATLSALNALQLVDDAPTLVIAPLRVARDTWPEEARKWQHTKHLDIMPIIGSEKERLAALRFDRPIYSCNYDNLVWLVEHYGDRWPFRNVVSDESTRLKSLRLSYRTSKTGKEFLAGQGGVRTRALGKIAHTKIERFIQLSGTPAPNGLADLWGQMWFLDAGARLGRTHTAFMQRWFKTDYDGYGTVAMPHAQEQIQDALRDLCITVDPKDWFDLKTPFINNVYVTLPAKARALYREMEKEMFVKLEEHGIEAANAAVLTGKLLQLCLSEGTEVLTNRGWLPIEKYDATYKLWDGFAWVNCGKLLYQGVQDVVNCFGVWMTPDHRVLTNLGWMTAKEILENGDAREKLTRSDFRLPDSAAPGREFGKNKIKAGLVARALRVRGRIHNGGCLLEEHVAGVEKVLRLPKAGDDIGCVGHARHDTAPHLAHVEWYAPTLLKPEEQGLEKLRRSRDNCVRKLEGVLRELFQGYGAGALQGRIYRAHRQFSGVLAGELQMGYPRRASIKYTGERVAKHAGRCDDAIASGVPLRVEGNNPCEAARAGVERGEGAHTTRKARTFDIADVGPRNCFVVRYAGGEPFIVHNCNGALYYDDKHNWKEIHDAKIQAVESVISETDGVPLLVAYNFKSDLVRLQRAFPKGVLLSNEQGATAFKQGKASIGFGHAKSIGHGYDGLQEHCWNIVFFGHDWNLEEYQQIIERVGPMRQEQSGHGDRLVTIHHIIARDTVDEMVMERRASKREVQDILLEAMKRRKA